MSYTKQTWANGDIITAAKLNHMEDGIAGVEADVSSLDTQLLASMPHDTASGSIASFPDGAALPVRDLNVSIEPAQNLNGYDNPWPGGGGVNKLIECVPGTYTGTYCQAVVSADGTITVSGTSGGSSDEIIIPLKAKITTPSEQFYLHMFNTVNASIAPSFELSTDIARTTINAACSPENRIYTVSTNRLGVEIDRVRFWIGANKDAAATLHPMFALTNSVVPWTPYSNICPISGWTGANIHVSPTTDAADGTTYSITFPTEAEIVYGGTLDVATGKLTVDRTMLDMSSITDWNIDRGEKRIYKVRSELAPASAASVVADGLICNRFKSITANDIYSNIEGVAISVGSDLQFHINGITDDANLTLAMVNTYFANNSTIVVAKLATPIEVDLTPTEVTTLLGTNNVWSDTGDTTVDYYADTTLFVNKKIAAAVAALS